MRRALVEQALEALETQLEGQKIFAAEAT